MRTSANGFDQGNNAKLFYIYNNQTDGLASSPAIGAILEGYARDAAGKLLPITISINSVANLSWIQINYAAGIIDLPLFRAPFIAAMI